MSDLYRNLDRGKTLSPCNSLSKYMPRIVRHSMRSPRHLQTNCKADDLGQYLRLANSRFEHIPGSSASIVKRAQKECF